MGNGSKKLLFRWHLLAFFATSSSTIISLSLKVFSSVSHIISVSYMSRLSLFLQVRSSLDVKLYQTYGTKAVKGITPSKGIFIRINCFYQGRTQGFMVELTVSRMLKINFTLNLYRTSWQFKAASSAYSVISIDIISKPEFILRYTFAVMEPNQNEPNVDTLSKT